MTWEVVLAVVSGTVIAVLGGAFAYGLFRPMVSLIRMLGEEGPLGDDEARTLYLFHLFASRVAILLAAVGAYAWSISWLAAWPASSIVLGMSLLAFVMKIAPQRRMRKSEGAGGRAVWRL